MKYGKTEVCEICIGGKQTKQPFTKTRKRATRPLERIHSDLCGPITPETFNGIKYILTLIDDFTHFTVVFGLKSKSEVCQYLKVYEARVTSHFPYKIRTFRCDNGTEYVNGDVKDFFCEKGIQYELTIPETPENNGVAERSNRTILDKARCMLLGSSLKKTFWFEAVCTAVYLINRSPTSALSDMKTPAEMWYGFKPDLSKLRIFGCVAYLHKPKDKTDGKFDARSKKCIMLGYCDNGYRLWSLEDKKVIVGRNVIFNETETKIMNTGWNYDWEDSDRNDASVEEIDNQQVLENDNREIQECENENEEQIRKSNRVRMKPQYLKDYATLTLTAKHINDLDEDEYSMALNAINYCNNVPQTFEELKERDDRDLWLKAVKEEIHSLEENNTWELIELPYGKIPIKTKWVFTLKQDGDGKIERFKARMVIKGCAQKQGIDYGETYAPVARLSTLRALVCLASKQNMLMEQLDVKMRFYMVFSKKRSICYHQKV